MKKAVKQDTKSYEDDEDEMITQLKEKFHNTTLKSEKLQILTVY